MGKHSLGKHLEKNKSKKINKIIPIIITIIGIIAVIIQGIIMIKNRTLDEKKEIEENINNTFISLKNLDINQVNQHMNYKDLVNSLDEIILEQNKEGESNIERKLFSNMEWTVESVKILDKNAAEAIIEMTNKNYNNIIIKWMELLLQMDASDVNNEIQLQKLDEILKETNTNKTVIKKINLIKNDEKWIIKVDDNLRDLVFSGIESIATVIEEYN